MSPLLAKGLELMLMGMGTVFVFLILLVFATTAMSRVVAMFAGAPVESKPAGAGPSEEEVAAITMAVAAHRARNRSR